ncbi:pyridoxal-phosphate dependent enzyme [Maritalea mobilis]|uniref:pyridoxal-phosphate dependent enzyme n=1 Tax=Maritalea mobilis TaxID=483324 RepID=UPI001C93D97A|nr:pyridoxal-phosphate dependent enzyme [Maritalea mobilis]MBY6203018.1 pyridoxal-phosphate dependent enzyme [Maritalea mobilis]
MKFLQNPWRHAPLPDGLSAIPGDVAEDAAPVEALLAQCPKHRETPLVSVPELAAELGVSAIHVKDERNRMGLGSFKALGASHVIARDAVEVMGDDPAKALAGRTYVAASAGNHGLSVAAGAGVFGARAVIYLSETVPAAFADLLRQKGAEVVVEGADYEASMAAAEARAAAEGWTLLSDSTWDGYDIGKGVMEGYLAMAAEAARQIHEAPTHIFLQAGVGGLAAACAAYARRAWGDGPIITVVEPDAAETLMASIKAGRPTHAAGPVSTMGRLDCKDPSHIALKSLAQTADTFLSISDAECDDAISRLPAHGLATSPSGGAGFAGLLHAPRKELRLGPDARVLLYLSEGPVDA